MSNDTIEKPVSASTEMAEELRRLREKRPVQLSVAGLPWRRIKPAPEILAVNRSAGQGKGELTLIGGDIFSGSDLKDTLDSYFRDILRCDIVCDCSYPLMIVGPMNLENLDSDPIPGHRLTIVYLVQINSNGNERLMYAGTAQRNRSASSATWFSMLTLPDPNLQLDPIQYRIFKRALQVLAGR